MDASYPKIRRLRATPVNVPLARPHLTASGMVSSALSKSWSEIFVVETELMPL